MKGGNRMASKKPWTASDALAEREALSLRSSASALSSVSENGRPERTTERTIAVVPGGEAQRAVLTVLSGMNAGQVFSLNEAEVVIGRGEDAKVWLEDAGVSRAHARILREGNDYFVEDLGSTNKTFLRGNAVEREILASGDRIQIGPHMIVAFAIIDNVEEALRHRLYEASTRDGLTRVYNKQFMIDRLRAEIAYAKRHSAKLSILMLDLDGFKNLNDTYGHVVGDGVLSNVAQQMLRLLRVEDMLARYGGEEFLILARGTGRTAANKLAERVRASIERLPLEKDGLSVTVSIGVATLSELTTDQTEIDLVDLADKRLYLAKDGGRNRVVSAS
jgi:two-component system, cell cycle response regulator